MYSQMEKRKQTEKVREIGNDSNRSLSMSQVSHIPEIVLYESKQPTLVKRSISTPQRSFNIKLHKKLEESKEKNILHIRAQKKRKPIPKNFSENTLQLFDDESKGSIKDNAKISHRKLKSPGVKDDFKCEVELLEKKKKQIPTLDELFTFYDDSKFISNQKKSIHHLNLAQKLSNEKEHNIMLEQEEEVNEQESSIQQNEQSQSYEFNISSEG
jgi:hypothetical protein